MSSQFSKSVKILAGHDYPKTFDEDMNGKLIKVEQKVTDLEIKASLSEKLEKTTDKVFKHTHQLNAKGRKRSQKEKQRKAEKRKTSRNVGNMEKVYFKCSRLSSN